MADNRINYPTAPIGGAMLAAGCKNLIAAIQDFNNLKTLLDEMTDSGSNPGVIDGSPEFDTVSGVGVQMYTAVSNLHTNLGSVTLQSVLDLYEGGVSNG
jgi:hypothetical protein